MNGYIKYFEKGSKNISFFIKDDEMLYKYNEIWDRVKEKLNMTFHSKPIYDKKYIKAKVREFDGVIKKSFGVMKCQNKICYALPTQHFLP